MSDRRPFLAGNWKMYLTREEASELARALRDAVGDEKERDVAVFPPFLALPAVVEVLAGSRIRVGAQTCHFEDEGAFTGEVSARMIRDAGADLVLVGHSERRHLFKETDEIVRAKLEAALVAGLEPVVCLGETLDDRKAERTRDIVRTQAIAAFEGLSSEAMKRVTVAYEPVWAIGTGLTASPEEAGEVHTMLRSFLRELFDGKGGGETADQVRILYGGSVKPANIDGLLRKSDIDGALVGGASLEAGSFTAIVGHGRG